ncbi:MAG: PEP-CTERM sorting domain-containing protein [Hyphomicrobiales bacterium]|nr:PEP-CTERM sorting domain-containing protein [Hyphomicrobiales bacterium]
MCKRNIVSRCRSLIGVINTANLKKTIAFGLIAGSILVLQPQKAEALTATWNFGDIADALDPAGSKLGELNWGSTPFAAGLLNTDGTGTIAVVASGFNQNATVADGFLDKDGDKGEAGLGVCSTAAGCETGGSGNPGDDEVGQTAGGETLQLNFYDKVGGSALAVKLESVRLTRSNPPHGAIPVGEKIGVGNSDGVAGATPTSITFIDGLLDLSSLTTANAIWTLTALLNETSFYVNAITVSFDTNDCGATNCANPPGVPVPPALLLFGSGLLGLGFLSARRRKKLAS